MSRGGVEERRIVQSTFFFGRGGKTPCMAVSEWVGEGRGEAVFYPELESRMTDVWGVCVRACVQAIGWELVFPASR